MPSPAAAPSGQLTLLLDDRDYQNLKFDLSADGQTIVVQRVSQQNPADFGPWLLREGKAPEPIETEPGGDFLIAPDSQSLLLLQGQGTAIIDLGDSTRGPRQPLDFLPNYGRVLDMAADGGAAAMVNFNQDDPEKRFTESLFLVTNQGREEELMQVNGAILDAQFAPSRQVLYVLASELVESSAASEPGTLQAVDAYEEQPLLLAITLADASVTPLLRLPQRQRIHMSVAPDGRSLLLDLVSQGPEPEADARIWLLPVVQQPLEPEDEETALQAIADSTEGAEGAGDGENGQDGEGETSAPTAVPAVLEPEPFPFGGLQATWLP